MRNPHVDIVHHHAQLIRWQARRPQQHKVLNLRILHFPRAKHGVLEFGNPRPRNLKTNRPRNPLRFFCGSLRLAQIAAIARNHLFRFRRFIVALALLLLVRRVGSPVSQGLAVTRISRPARQNLLPSGAIHFQPLRLKIRSLVPFNSKPLQPFQDAIHKLRPIAFHVGIFDPQQKCATLMPCEKPIEKSGARAANVQISRGRRSESHTRFLRGIHSVNPFMIRKQSILADSPLEIERAQRKQMKRLELVRGYC